MTLEINKRALKQFAEVVEEQPTALVTLEHISELTTAMGFKCRLASVVQTWKQKLTVEGPPSTLSPLEVQIDTPWGEQEVELEPRLQPSAKVQAALKEFHHTIEMLDRRRETARARPGACRSGARIGAGPDTRVFTVHTLWNLRLGNGTVSGSDRMGEPLRTRDHYGTEVRHSGGRVCL